MATVLDIGLLESFSQLFTTLLVIFLVYGLLTYAKPFGDKKGLYSLIAFILGIMMLLVPSVSELLVTITPWFVIMFIFVIFILMVYGIFGAKEEDFLGALKSARGNQIVTWVIVISIIILLGGLGKVYFTGEEATTEVTGEGTIQKGDVGEVGTGAFWATIFHPKVLGLIMILLICVFTIMLLTSQGRVD
ncbi:hypothetical protein HQ529_00030 [Candidatus Woesearchaeota archaeon]|nr:hypothetical protein [Candidatus Woesearchaeota archaeon]